MFERPFWINRIEEAWRQVPIAWLCGVRRCGKTTLAESLGSERVLYVNCDLPKFEEMTRDPQTGAGSLGSGGKGWPSSGRPRRIGPRVRPAIVRKLESLRSPP